MARRILHVIPALAPRYGGPSAAVLGMSRALRAAGDTCLIASTDADGAGRLRLDGGPAGSFEGVPVMFFPRELSESFKWSRPLATWLRSHVADFDVVHVHAVFSHASIAAMRACRLSRVPYVVRPLGTLNPWSLDRHGWRKRLLLAAGVRRLLEGAAAIHYTTSEERRVAEARLPWLSHGVVVPLGVDDELFGRLEHAPVERPPVLVTLGRLHEKKGIDVLIDAFHGTAGAVGLDTWRLRIAGDGAVEYVAALKRRADAGPARERIEFEGWVPGPARRDILIAARLFALPSHQENFGIAVVEAMACGLPVIVTPGVNLASEIAGAEAGWLSERTPTALTAALVNAMSNPGEIDRRGKLARQLAERFRWGTVVAELQSVYDAVRRPHRVAVAAAC